MLTITNKFNLSCHCRLGTKKYLCFILAPVRQLRFYVV